jgi:hypothetical protein
MPIGTSEKNALPYELNTAMSVVWALVNTVITDFINIDGNRPSGSVKCRDCLDKLSEY